MTIKTFRILDHAYKASALSGEGASQYPGRWNTRGVRAVYTAQSLSLAILEILVHLEDEGQLRKDWVYCEVSLDASHIVDLPGTALPPGWDAHPVSPATRGLGDDWMRQARSIGLRVPSVLVPGEYNIVLNPAHPRFDDAVSTGPFKSLALDPRLFKKGEGGTTG